MKRHLRLASLLAALLVPAGCGDGRPPADRDPVPGGDSITVYFTRDEAQVGVVRLVPDGEQTGPETALRLLLRGPVQDEERTGITSWFSEETAGALRDFTLDPEGNAIVDFHDLSAIIPNASTSFGSAMLLGELNRTLFSHPEVRSAEYRMEGSCDRFWNWLQYSCEVVPNPE